MPKPFNLLGIPTEVRLLILRELVGDSVVHIGLCYHQESPLSALEQDERGNYLYDLFSHVYVENTTALPETNDHGVKFTIIPYTKKVGRQLFAQSWGCPTPAKYKRGMIEKSYAVLKTCHQIYEEASSVLYSTNIFSFQYARNLSDFLENRSPYQMSKISSIRISDSVMCTNKDNGLWISDWDRYLMALPSGHFSALRTIHLDVTSVHREWASHTRTTEGDLMIANDTLQELLKLIEWLTIHRGLRVKEIPVTYTLYGVHSASGEDIFPIQDFNNKNAKPHEIHVAKMRDKTLKGIAEFLVEQMMGILSTGTGTASEQNTGLLNEPADDEMAVDDAVMEAENENDEEEGIDSEDEWDASYSVCASSTDPEIDSEAEELGEYDSESESVQELLLELSTRGTEEGMKYTKDLDTAAGNWTKMMGYEEGERDESRCFEKLKDRKIRNIGFSAS